MKQESYYHYMLRKEREMAKWKGDPFTPTTYYCDKCGQKSALPMPVTVSKYVRNDTKDYKFCSRECHDEFYMDRMRNLGL